MSDTAEEQVSKRRRRLKTKTFDFEDVDNEEQRMIQQALKNSQMQTTRIAVDVPDAPVYYPTVEEFMNPLKYISSIRAEAERYGICKIVPPAEWRPPCMLDFNDPRKFPTKLQVINVLQEGQGFDSGKNYNLREYKEMADAFYKEWIDKHYCDGGMEAPKLDMSLFHGYSPAEGKPQGDPVVKSEPSSAQHNHGELDQATINRYAKLAKDYWDMVEMGTGSVVKRASIEYANDIDTTNYCSGFPLRAETLTSEAANANKSKHGGTDKQQTAEQVVAANAAAIAAAAKLKMQQAADGRIPITPSVGVESPDCPDMFSHDYYTRTGWNLVNIAASDGSVLTHLKTKINGINVPWLYIETKQWYGVPGAHAKNFEKVSKNFLLQSFDESPDLLHHMTTQISPSLLASSGVPVYQCAQTARTFVVTFPKAFHAGFSYGFNIGEAVNFATPDWLPEGTQADERYRSFARASVFSHQRLLLTLLYHNVHESTMDQGGQLRDTAAYGALLQEIKKLLDEELMQRPFLISQGVRDISHLIKLPGNNFGCIDESSSNYDDLRSCWACKHICLLTAVACECDRNKVTCARHYASACKCPKEKRYILEWMPTADLQSMRKKVERLLGSQSHAPIHKR